MSINQEINFNGITIKVQGNVENPLFDCQQILIHVLGYAESNKNRFYQDNKNNVKYIVLMQQEGSLALSEGGQKRYFTEIGLFKCLFTSQKPIAIEFQEQVALLLKDIRIGNIKLHAQKECETIRIIESKENSLLSYIARVSELEQQMLELREQLQRSQTRLSMAQEDVFIYEIEIEGKLYRGSAIDVLQRIKQHMARSSNKHIKRAQSLGCQMQVRLIHQQVVSNRHERNYIENIYINQIPQEKRLNMNMPRVRDLSLVSAECIEELKQALESPVLRQFPRPISVTRQSSQIRQRPIMPVQQTESEEQKEPVVLQQQNSSLNLTIITEESRQRGITINYREINIGDHTDYIENLVIDSEFKQKILAIKQFEVQNGFTPRDSDKIPSSERSLGQLLVKIRNAYRSNSTQNYALTAERYAFILHTLPNLLKDDNQYFYDKVLQMKQFILANRRLPKQRNQNNENEEESRLYDWLAHRRTDFKQGKLNQTCIAFFNEQLPDLQFVVPDAESRFNTKVDDLKHFIDKYGRYPTQKENKVLQSFVRDIQTADKKDTKSRVKMTPARKTYIQKVLPTFPWE